MNSLDRFMEYLVAGVFLCVGLAKIWSYRRRPKPLGAQRARLPFGLPHGLVVAVGLFEVLAALALLTPYSFLPQAMIAPLAIAGLALLTWSAAFYHIRRHESAVPNLVLFLLVMFVALARWI
jgi:VIT1/CCC1 family predicted Fe2+/Mn2+ transporter